MTSSDRGLRARTVGILAQAALCRHIRSGLLCVVLRLAFRLQRCQLVADRCEVQRIVRLDGPLARAVRIMYGPVAAASIVVIADATIPRPDKPVGRSTPLVCLGGQHAFLGRVCPRRCSVVTFRRVINEVLVCGDRPRLAHRIELLLVHQSLFVHGSDLESRCYEGAAGCIFYTSW